MRQGICQAMLVLATLSRMKRSIWQALSDADQHHLVELCTTTTADEHDSISHDDMSNLASIPYCCPGFVCTCVKHSPFHNHHAHPPFHSPTNVDEEKSDKEDGATIAPKDLGCTRVSQHKFIGLGCHFCLSDAFVGVSIWPSLPTHSHSSPGVFYFLARLLV